MDEKEIIIFKKPSKWTAWRLQRRILKKHAYIFGVKPRLFESNESLRQRILENKRAEITFMFADREEGNTRDEQKPD